MRHMVGTAILCAIWLPSLAVSNDFPTQARVEYVLRCMDARGGQTYETMYSCVCLIDRIAENILYEDFTEAEVYSQLRSTPGERGGVFRDPDRASLLVKKLRDVTEAAEKACLTTVKADTADKE